MERIIAKNATSLRAVLAQPLQALRLYLRQRRDAARIDALPQDRLRDMGLSGRTEANARQSHQRGDLPKASLW